MSYSWEFIGGYILFPPADDLIQQLPHKPCSHCKEGHYCDQFQEKGEAAGMSPFVQSPQWFCFIFHCERGFQFSVSFSEFFGIIFGRIFDSTTTQLQQYKVPEYSAVGSFFLLHVFVVPVQIWMNHPVHGKGYCCPLWVSTYTAAIHYLWLQITLTLLVLKTEMVLL